MLLLELGGLVLRGQSHLELRAPVLRGQSHLELRAPALRGQRLLEPETPALMWELRLLEGTMGRQLGRGKAQVLGKWWEQRRLRAVVHRQKQEDTPSPNVCT